MAKFRIAGKFALTAGGAILVLVIASPVQQTIPVSPPTGGRCTENAGGPSLHCYWSNAGGSCSYGAGAIFGSVWKCTNDTHDAHQEVMVGTPKLPDCKVVIMTDRCGDNYFVFLFLLDRLQFVKL